jgi:heat shock protein HslJ
MKTRQIFAVFALLVVILSACSSFSSQPDVNGASWTLTQLQGRQISSPPVPTLIFKDGKVSGNASCNHFGGSYQRGLGETLKIEQLMSTLMACADQSAMAQEGHYLAMLAKVAKYRVDNNHLYLYDQADQLLAEFNKQ